MQKKFLTTTFICLCLCFSVFAQNSTFTLHLPHFAGDTAYIAAFSGSKIDTIATVTLDNNGNGQVTRQWPNPGICFLQIRKNGVNFPFIRSAGENPVFECDNEYVYAEAAKFSGSAENDSVIAWNRQKMQLQEKQLFWNGGKHFYSEGTPQTGFIEKELDALQQQSDALDKTLNSSELYAAKYLKIKFFIDEYSPLLGEYEQDSLKLTPFRKYFVEELDIDALYASDMWFNAFNALLMVYRPLGNYQRDGVFVQDFGKDFRQIYSRIANRRIRAAFAADVKDICRQLGREFPLTELLINDLLPIGSPAPALMLKKGKQKVKNSLLIFHESGCNNCENELDQLIGNYPELKEKGIRIISIAADTDSAIYEKTAAGFPWTDKYCDFEGLEGPNFRAWYAIGTPTIFAIDKNGNITGRYARLADYLKDN